MKNTIKGWMSEIELDFLNTKASEMNKVVELGSYLGRSTVALADGCKKLIAIDNWEGSEGLDMDGTEFKQFLENIKPYNNIEVIRGYSLEVGKYFEHKVDMVFIDADHTYDAVKADIAMWKPKANKLICGHDYDIDSVKRAVDESLEIDGCVGSIWWKEL